MLITVQKCCVSVFVPRTTAAAAAAAAIGPYAVRGIAEETEKIKKIEVKCVTTWT